MIGRGRIVAQGTTTDLVGARGTRVGAVDAAALDALATALRAQRPRRHVLRGRPARQRRAGGHRRRGPRGASRPHRTVSQRRRIARGDVLRLTAATSREGRQHDHRLDHPTLRPIDGPARRPTTRPKRHRRPPPGQPAIPRPGARGIPRPTGPHRGAGRSTPAPGVGCSSCSAPSSSRLWRPGHLGREGERTVTSYLGLGGCPWRSCCRCSGSCPRPRVEPADRPDDLHPRAATWPRGHRQGGRRRPARPDRHRGRPRRRPFSRWPPAANLDSGPSPVPGVILMLTDLRPAGRGLRTGAAQHPLAIVGALVLPTVWTIPGLGLPTVAKVAVCSTSTR